MNFIPTRLSGEAVNVSGEKYTLQVIDFLPKGFR